MYLKRLELSGFKSFGKKTELDFTAPITAIVGPNGSGKSNVAEAVRFVLGEQSMKSLRGKQGADLIFKGGRSTGGLGRASVAIVFDNRKRIFSKGKEDSGGGPSDLRAGINVDFDDIVISREVYGDGENHYLVNGTQVRLKDIIELLAPLNIGSSGHHIISQGEADKILNASIKERKEMIEDALGLRVYQYKIFESERKLEKTTANVKEAEVLRRELAPHIAFLKKQVEKIEKAKEMQEDLASLYGEYLGRERSYLDAETAKLNGEAAAREELKKLDHELAALRRELTLNPENEASNEKRTKLEASVGELRGKKDELSRRLGRLEGIIELEEERLRDRAHRGGEAAQGAVPLSEVESLAREVETLADEAVRKSDLSSLRNIVLVIKEKLSSFVKKKRDEGEAPARTTLEDKLSGYKKEKADAERALSVAAAGEKALGETLEKLKQGLEKTKETLRDKERSYFELSSKRSDLASRVGVLSMKEEKLRSEEEDFARELAEAAVLVGAAAAHVAPVHEEEAREKQEERRRKIERLKIRLEDIGVGSSGETMKEYEDITARDRFLEGEIADLKKSKSSLEALIADLKEKLGSEFKEGVKKINAEFTAFFRMLFGGGTAALSVVKREKRRYGAEEDEEGAALLGEEKEYEEGIEIAVSLPQKKIKDLAMLSGGERALTSISLLFAVTQVNPPPFLILDETDAALDEANSRKYADMLESLSAYSNLVVITHNRETMSRANVLYGITMGGEGISKMLSVKFDEAAAYAK